MNGPYIIVIGNQKGGTGKSTTAMHLIVSLLRHGHRVGAIDLDATQGTLSRYLENRRNYASRRRMTVEHPELRAVYASELDNRTDAIDEERRHLADALAELSACEYIVIDTPGADSTLSRLGHTHADTLITPMNDSFVDLDLLAVVDPDTLEVVAPSRYSEMVWEQKKARAIHNRRPIDWIVIRNRVAALGSRNNRNVDKVLKALAGRIGFRTAPGFGERVIFRELFLKGLTLLDLREDGTDVPLTLSHVAARQEVRTLLAAIGFSEVPDEPGTTEQAPIDPPKVPITGTPRAAHRASATG
ncbi:MAG: division plane positioning ATPase MipZ [Alphaproteobacteria bacterium]